MELKRTHNQNTKLIMAAAPELFETCKDAYNSLSGTLTVNEILRLTKRLKQAITKAEGKK